MKATTTTTSTPNFAAQIPINKDSTTKSSKPGVLKTTCAITAAIGSFSAFNALSSIAANKYLNESILKNNFQIPQDYYEKILESAKPNKKVTIIHNTEEIYSKTKEFYNILLHKKGLNKYPKLKNKIQAMILKPFKEAKEGRNSFFYPQTNSILINPKGKTQFAIFHEIGHALNCNNSKFCKNLQKLRTPSTVLIGGIAIATAIFKQKKEKSEKPESLFDKTTTFVKNNCGKIAFLSMTPILIEEGIATLKGNKLAKEFLSPDKLKELKRLNQKAYFSYILLALSLGASTYITSVIRDKIGATAKN